MVDVKTLLAVLPSFRNDSETLIDEQDVNDIMDEIYESHLIFASDYDAIYKYFDTGNILTTARNLFDFCKKNIQYTVEPQEDQTVRSPAAILALRNSGGDCKHYAGFIAGILSAIERNTRQKFKWCYRYSNYDMFSDAPGHVFVVLNCNGGDYWIDPVLSRFNERLQPNFYIDDKIPKSMLSRISGIQSENFSELDSLMNNSKVAAVLQPSDFALDIPYDLHGALVVLMNNGIMNAMGDIDTEQLNILTAGPNVNPDIRSAINVLQHYLQADSIGNWFDDAFKFIQHNAAILGMQVPRAAFLGLVRLNAFHYATKLAKGLTYEDVKNKMADRWERVGGKFSELVNSIGIGAKKRPVISGIDGSQVGCTCGGNCTGGDGTIGCVEAASAAACLIASAAVIVAAIIPIITKLLASHSDPVVNTMPTDPTTGLPIGYQSNKVLSWLQGNPLIVVGGIILVGYFLTDKKGA